jgi:hypothetical protein
MKTKTQAMPEAQPGTDIAARGATLFRKNLCFSLLSL